MSSDTNNCTTCGGRRYFHERATGPGLCHICDLIALVRSLLSTLGKKYRGPISRLLSAVEHTREESAALRAENEQLRKERDKALDVAEKQSELVRAGALFTPAEWQQYQRAERAEADNARLREVLEGDLAVAELHAEMLMNAAEHAAEVAEALGDDHEETKLVLSIRRRADNASAALGATADAIRRALTPTATPEPAAGDTCLKCDGEGWLWWDELDEYHGPALKTGEDDTRYTCDACRGTGRAASDTEEP